jgi:hypothetical protein
MRQVLIYKGMPREVRSLWENICRFLQTKCTTIVYLNFFSSFLVMMRDTLDGQDLN